MNGRAPVCSAYEGEVRAIQDGTNDNAKVDRRGYNARDRLHWRRHLAILSITTKVVEEAISLSTMNLVLASWMVNSTETAWSARMRSTTPLRHSTSRF